MSKLRSNKITQSANGEDCTVNSATCNYRNETVVYAHLPFDSGMGTKSSDASGCYACSNCHDLIDLKTKSKEFTENREWYLRRALTRTIVRLFEKKVYRIGRKGE